MPCLSLRHAYAFIISPFRYYVFIFARFFFAAVFATRIRRHCIDFDFRAMRRDAAQRQLRHLLMPCHTVTPLRHTLLLLFAADYSAKYTLFRHIDIAFCFSLLSCCRHAVYAAYCRLRHGMLIACCLLIDAFAMLPLYFTLPPPFSDVTIETVVAARRCRLPLDAIIDTYSAGY